MPLPISVQSDDSVKNVYMFSIGILTVNIYANI